MAKEYNITFDSLQEMAYKLILDAVQLQKYLMYRK